MRLGLGQSSVPWTSTQLMWAVAIIFFLWRYYTIQHEREKDGVLEDRAKEKKEIQLKIRECKKGGADPNETYFLEQKLAKL
jgi:hypothetical protein